MNIKAQGLLNAAEYIQERYGDDALRDVLRACSVDVRDRYVSAIAINWHPISEFVEFLEVAERQLGRNDGRLAEEIGAAGARKNMKGTILRVAFYVSKPEFLLKRITHLWRQFNDQGSMDLLQLDASLCTIEIKGIGTPHWLFCATINGWAREVATKVGGVRAIAKHSECLARGGRRCIFEMRSAGGFSTGAEWSKDASPIVAPPRSDKQEEVPTSRKIAIEPDERQEREASRRRSNS